MMLGEPCRYITDCGWCWKWDKKCDKKIGPEDTNCKPPRGLRANAGLYDEVANLCTYCDCYEYGDPKCPTCRENNYKFFKQMEKSLK